MGFGYFFSYIALVAAAGLVVWLLLR